VLCIRFGFWPSADSRAYSAGLQTRSGQCRAASVKSASVVSRVNLWRMHSWPRSASIVPIWNPSPPTNVTNIRGVNVILPIWH
jgi:hypothetical protein